MSVEEKLTLTQTLLHILTNEPDIQIEFGRSESLNAITVNIKLQNARMALAVHDVELQSYKPGPDELLALTVRKLTQKLAAL